MTVYMPIQRQLPLRDSAALSKVELEEYFNWFFRSLPERVAILEGAVRSAKNWPNWRATYGRSSLETLASWLAAHVETRARTPQDVEYVATVAPLKTAITAFALLVVRAHAERREDRATF